MLRHPSLLVFTGSLWKLLLLTFKIIAALAVLLSGFLMYSNWKYSGKLAQARAVTQLAIDEAKAANAASERAELVAEEAQVAADRAHWEAATHAEDAKAARAKLAAIRAAIPTGATTLDTLAARIAASRESTTVALQEAYSWQLAYESQLEATARLQAAVDTLAPALQAERAASQKLQGGAQTLVDATGDSFWKRLVPKLSINATVGVDPLKPQEGIKKVVGIGGSWEL